ncbi:CDP-alcohol phosphatidyltransferase family protein [Thermaurantiacus sp.]
MNEMSHAAIGNPRPPEIELPSNRYLIHRASDWLLPRAVALGIPANAVSLAGLGMGLLAALAYYHAGDWRLAWLGWAAMMGWLVLDGLDGSVARATGTASPFGRFLDGFADYGVFVVVYLALVASQPNPGWHLVLALAAGAAHAVQAALYEAKRATFVRRRARVLSVEPRRVAGGILEAFYNRGEEALGHRESALDQRLAALPDPWRSALLNLWLGRAAVAMRPFWLLSSNARVHAILLFSLAGVPSWFWWYELTVLTAIALLGNWRWAVLERHMLNEAGGPMEPHKGDGI